ncbi:hypothetical protein MDOR_11470 [Mycolicibacterium doricum]|uniref:Uncharacterized protein n=1 Tax=Mycolicibacterium doricum TaxID=126673 RepID=A0A7I7VU21_9MYCO|nr:hypothetical protein MDOR_11470 [Mycolicibacterium doricum]
MTTSSRNSGENFWYFFANSLHSFPARTLFGPQSGKWEARHYELEAAKADNARLSEALKEMAVRLTLVEGKGSWG